MKLALYTSALCALAAASPAYAQSTAAQRYDIPAGSLDRALTAFARQGGAQILYASSLVEGRLSPGLAGSYDPDAALAILLQGSGLTYRQSQPNVYVLFAPTVRADSDDDEETRLDEVVVTGSYLRGAPSPSPVTILSATDLERRGRSTVADALAQLPQNFTGAAYEGSAGTGADRSGVNLGYATGLNLRGLGADATLVLVNGRRIAGTGGSGDFADISSIPSAAVERVEVLLDGASALYGADAIGGVVNVILRSRFAGHETRLRFGATTDGGAEEFVLSQTSGRDWRGGSLVVAYEHQDRGEVRADQRNRTASADLRPFGGTDHREFYAAPGNVMAYDPVAGGFRPAYAIPPGQDGSSLQPSDFQAGLVNLSNQNEGLWILPHQRRDSVFLAATQVLPWDLLADGEVRATDRRFESHSFADISLLTITDANPHFVSPDGSNSHDIAYSFIRELGPGRDEGSARSIGGSFGLRRSFGDWNAGLYASGGRDAVRSYAYNRVNQSALAEALGSAPDDPATTFNTAVDGFFNPYGDPAANSAAMRAFIGTGFSDARYRSGVGSLNVRIDGSLVDLPGGPLRLAVGGDHRQETFQTSVVNFFYGSTPPQRRPRAFERTVSAAFFEARAPLFGADNARPGLERLEVSLAARAERYDDVGLTTTPKIGLLYQPASDLTFRASYGESFRAPTLLELNGRTIIVPTVLNDGLNDVIVLMRYGGNPGLDPETADSFTAGAVWSPVGWPGVRMEAGWFRTNFSNQISQPASDYADRALIDPALAPFVTFVSPGVNAADLALIESLLADPNNLLPDIFPATAYGAVVDARYVNAAVLTAEGFDLNLRYARTVGPGDLTLEGALTHIARFERRITPGSPADDLAGQPHFPARWRSRIGAWWQTEAFGTGLWANYVSGGRDAVRGGRIGDWMTLDGQVRYDVRWRSTGDVAVILNVLNVLNTEPPFYDALRGIGYDAANTNVLGRQVSLQLVRRW